MIARINPGTVVTHQRWVQFYDLVAETRQLQRVYRRTIDSRVRRQMEENEFRLDAMLASIDGEMTTEAEAAVVVEGGAA